LLAWTEGQGARLTAALVRGIAMRRQRQRDLSRALPRPEDLTRPATQRLDFWGDRLPRALTAYAAGRHRELSRLSGAIRPASLIAKTRAARTEYGKCAQRLEPALGKGLSHRRAELDKLARRLTLRPARRAVEKGRAELPKCASRLDALFLQGMAARRDRLAGSVRLLEGLSYHGTLARGFAVVWAGDTVVTRVAGARPQTALEIEFQDGRVAVTQAGGSAGRKTSAGPKQPSLFED
jgi:exodeoxyribonuclease VII large subunit